MDLESLKEKYPQIVKANEIVRLYEFHIEGVAIPLKVKVVRSGKGTYHGIANLEVKGDNCATYYRSIEALKSEQEAVENAVDGFFMFYSGKADVREVRVW